MAIAKVATDGIEMCDHFSGSYWALTRGGGKWRKLRQESPSIGWKSDHKVFVDIQCQGGAILPWNSAHGTFFSTRKPGRGSPSRGTMRRSDMRLEHHQVRRQRRAKGLIHGDARGAAGKPA